MPDDTASEGLLDDALERGSFEPLMLVDVSGFEGPLDLLLALARQQKVDLATISIAELAGQYLDFIDRARALRLELAADYLLMAAWLAYLKSRLLLPLPPAAEEPSGQELAEALAKRLIRLEEMRLAGARLLQRPQLGQEFFTRGMPESFEGISGVRYQADLVDLLKAYAGTRQKLALSRVTMRLRPVWSLETARAALQQLTGMALEWTALDRFIIAYLPDKAMRASALASSFSASLEMAREGMLELRQEQPFAALYVRRRQEAEHG